MPVQIPWAPSSSYDRRSNIGQLILEAGRIRAEGAARSGEIWGNAIASVGQHIGQTIQDAPRRKLEATRAAEEEDERKARKAEMERLRQADQAFMTRLNDPKPVDPREVVALYGPQRGAAIVTGLKSMMANPPDLKGTMAGFEALGSEEGRAAVWPTLRQRFMAGGDIPEEAVPKDYDQGWYARFKKALAGPAKLQNVPAGASVIDEANPAAGAVFTAPSAPAKPPAPPPVGGFEDYVVRKYGPQPTPAQIESAKRAFAQADDKPPAPKEPIKVDVFNEQTGEMETRFITHEDAAAMARGEKPPMSKGPGTAERNRMAAARTSIERGEALLSELKDPKFAEKIGAVVGRYNSLAAAAGAGDPDAQYLVGALKSFSALQPQIHGFRAVQMAQDVEKLLNTKQSPEALSGALKGILTASYGVAKKPAPAAGPSSAPAAPKVGDVVRGYVFLGGDPADQKSWKKK